MSCTPNPGSLSSCPSSNTALMQLCQQTAGPDEQPHDSRVQETGVCPQPCRPPLPPCPGAPSRLIMEEEALPRLSSPPFVPMPGAEHRQTVLPAWGSRCHRHPESSREPGPNRSGTKAALATLSCAAQQRLIPWSLFSSITLAGTSGLKSGNVGTCCWVPRPASTHPVTKYSSP